MTRYYLPGAVFCFLSALVIGVLSVAHSRPSGAAEAFESVKYLMPGQSVSVALMQPNCELSAPSYAYYDSYRAACYFEDGPFAVAFMYLGDEADTVKTLYLTVRGHTIQAGELAQWFDGVRRIGRRSMRVLTWDGGRAWCWVGRSHIFSGYVEVFAIRLDKPVS